MIKLVFVGFFFLFLIGCVKKEEANVAFESRLVADECVGYIRLDSLAQEIKECPLFSSYPLLKLFNVDNLLFNLGIKENQLFFSANIENKSARAFLQVADSNAFDAGVNSLSQQYKLRKEMLGNHQVICWDAFNMKAVRVDSLLLITYNLPVEKEVLTLKSHTTYDTVWTSVFAKKGVSFYSQLSSQILADFSVKDIRSTLHLDSLVRFSFLVRKQPDFPFLFEQPSVSLSNSESSIYADLQLKRQEIYAHPKWSQLLSKLGNKISFPSVKFLQALQGQFHFFKGGKAVERVSEIVTVLDENFNTVEQEKITNKVVDALAFVVDLNESSDSLFYAMKLSGFLNQIDKLYYFFVAPPLNSVKVKNKHYFYSGTTPPKLKSVNSTTLFAFQSKKGRIELNLILDDAEQSVYEITLDLSLDSLENIADLSATIIE